MEKENSKSLLNKFIHTPWSYGKFARAIFAIRLIVGCVFLSEGIQKFLFSESLGRFVVTVAPDNKRAFERTLGSDAILLGRVTGTHLRITACQLLLDLPVNELETDYKAPFREF